MVLSDPCERVVHPPKGSDQQVKNCCFGTVGACTPIKYIWTML